MSSFHRQAILEVLSRLVTPGIKLTALAACANTNTPRCARN